MANDFLKNPLWVHRVQEAFSLVDLNKNGYIELDDWDLWVRNMERVTNFKADPVLIDKLREVMHEYCAGFKVKKGTRVMKDQFVVNFAVFAASERAKKKRGEEPLLFKLNNAYFDVVDANHDGCVTLEEYRKVTIACNFDPSTADETFKLIDLNRNNKVERKELNEFEFKFWFEVDDPETVGMFGATFES